MKKLILFVLFAGLLTLVLQSVAEARVYRFNTLLNNSRVLAKFNPAQDQILFRHAVSDPFPLNYKQKDKGVEFKLDNGKEKTPRYNVLGLLPIEACSKGKLQISVLKNVHGSLVSLDCGK